MKKTIFLIALLGSAFLWKAYAQTNLKTGGDGKAIFRTALKQNASTRQKISFELKAPQGTQVELELFFLDGTRSFSRKKTIRHNSEGGQTYHLALDLDFQMSDAVYQIDRLKALIRTPKPAVVQIGKIEIKTNTEKLSAIPRILPVTEKRGLFSGTIRNPLKIYFDFDNSDRDPVFRTTKKSPMGTLEEKDTPQSTGFHVQLLEFTDGIIKNADSPEEADVILYSRATPGNPQKIIAAVRQGKRLIVYGNPPDKEIYHILPVETKEKRINGMARREPLTILEKNSDTENIHTQGRTFGCYSITTPKKDAVVLVSFPQGNAAITRKENVLHVGLGIGTNLTGKKSVFYDAGALYLAAAHRPDVVNALKAREREVSLFEKKETADRISQAAKIAKISDSESKDFRLGASYRNFGRFGWQIRDGLMTGHLNEDLSISNGSQRFAFSRKEENKFFPLDWDWKSNISNWKRPQALTEEWNGLGTAEFTTTFSASPEWKNKDLLFCVDDGIDDCDSVFLNEIPIGKTTSQEPYFWKRKREYVFSGKKLHYDKGNTIRILVENKKGTGRIASTPYLIPREPGNTEIRVTSCDWTGKTFSVSGNQKEYTMRVSLLSPFTLYQFSEKKIRLKIDHFNGKCFFYTQNGLQTKELKKHKLLYDSRTDGNFKKPWILLNQTNGGSPLMVVFSHQPQKLQVEFSNEKPAELTICGESEIGEIAAGWPFGSESRNFEQKPFAAHDETVLDKMSNLALCFPVSCEEIFKIDRKNSRIHIVDACKFHKLPDFCKIKPYPCVMMPLVAAAMQQAHFMVESNADDSGIKTKLGPVFLKENSESLSYTLPLPETKDFLPVGVQDSYLNALQNNFYAEGVKISAGAGKVKVGDWNAEFPGGVGKKKIRSISMFHFNFGMNQSLQGAMFLNQENRTAFQNRFRQRFMEPLERYQYKAFARHRKEPFSGLKYPVTFGFFTRLETNFAPGFGSKLMFIDNNEASTLLMLLAQKANDQLGQKDLVKNCWSYLNYVMKYQRQLHDYSFMNSSCEENGIGAWLDMLNNEYAGMLAYARLAEIAEEPEEKEYALYRAARAAVPQAGRFFFRKHFETIRPHFRKKKWSLIGFQDENTPYRIYPNKEISGCDFFDFSQGYTEATFRLYQKFAAKQVREQILNLSIPNMLEKGLFDHEYLAPAATLGGENLPLRKWLNLVLEKEKQRKPDWNNMALINPIGAVLWYENKRISFSVCRDLNLCKALYNPENRQLSLELTAENNAELVLEADTKPLSCSSGSLEIHPYGWKIPLKEGRNTIQIEFPRP